jgi:hypothetical protein
VVWIPETPEVPAPAPPLAIAAMSAGVNRRCSSGAANAALATASAALATASAKIPPTAVL